MQEKLSDGELLESAERLIAESDFGNAEKTLSKIKHKSGRLYFLKSLVYKNKMWYNQQRKMLKRALKAEPQNEEYITEYEQLEAFRKTAEYKELRRQANMGTCGELCIEGGGECCCLLICEGICEGL